jgi:hypothetical protein
MIGRLFSQGISKDEETLLVLQEVKLLDLKIQEVRALVLSLVAMARRRILQDFSNYLSTKATIKR